MSISSVVIYEKLKPKLGEEETKALIEYVDDVTKSGVATKEDLMSVHGELKGDMNTLRDELKGDMNTLRDELKRDMNTLRDELKGDINGLHEEIAVMKSNMATKDDIWKLRLLIIVVLLAVILFNPKVLDFLGKVLGVGM